MLISRHFQINQTNKQIFGFWKWKNYKITRRNMMHFMKGKYWKGRILQFEASNIIQNIALNGRYSFPLYGIKGFVSKFEIQTILVTYDFSSEKKNKTKQKLYYYSKRLKSSKWHSLRICIPRRLIKTTISFETALKQIIRNKINLKINRDLDK